MDDSKLIKTLNNLGVPQGELERLSVLADEMQCSVQQLLIEAVQEYLERPEQCFNCPLMYEETRL